MLIDAAHPEETRVVVVRDGKVEEFDFEAANRRQLRGNIYLAKVTRVEPSLQAAFVEYGGNRHGFLAFSEIHPDYYQIPQADRQALIEQEEAESASEADEVESPEIAGDDNGDEHETDGESGNGALVEVKGDQSVESVGGDDALEEAGRRKSARPRRNYKIQEVIKKRQILLVQVVKEERGNKGAALTTYLSLAGRYSVLMPNTARGGGISRKITSATDRKKLKEIASDLDVPQGMGVILRTAGASRTKAEIKRDFEYLLRLWENVRELTLKSIAPTLVYEEGSLVKRAIRDLYTKDIEQVLVAGEQAYREAKDFMRMLMPSHAKNVQQYREQDPIFTKNGVETQLDAMFSPVVTLRSGGYIVLNQTEALVSIDVNSGRSTKEHSIEETALKTNLEAADEVARQLRLRDLAGLVVIDFIDMDEKRNNRAVEKRLKDALRHDRARIQVGRISHFGLMEMSRQRIRTGVLESSVMPCPHCHGTGHVRSVESVALHVLRSIEHELLKSKPTDLVVRTSAAAALYILNQKRDHLRDIEQRFGIRIALEAAEPAGGVLYELEKGEPARLPVRETVDPVSVVIEEMEEEEAVETAEAGSKDSRDSEDEHDGESGGGRRRRRRRRRGRGSDHAQAEGQSSDESGDQDADDEEQAREAEDLQAQGDGDAEGEQQAGGRRRRRGRRGGRRHRREDGVGEDGAPVTEGQEAPEGAVESPSPAATAGEASEQAADATASEMPAEAAQVAQAEAAREAHAESAEGAAAEAGETGAQAAAPDAEAAAPAEESPAEKPKRRRAPRRSKKAEAAAAEDAAAQEPVAETEPSGEPTVATDAVEAAQDVSERAAEGVAPPDAAPQAAESAEPTAGEQDVPLPATEPVSARETVAAEAEVDADAARAEEVRLSGAEPELEAAAAPEGETAGEDRAREGAASESHPQQDNAPREPRRGWWQRRRLFGGGD
ncbi:Cytoplasmic axial filament protein CafA and Ribonuclease G [Lutibaculum baratangense AMV1]|uniref:Ribonuclease E n=2 Tax=Lutibaculum TaxID=1358438 RepID=V4TG23_9HYPH|nr:Cytoplasmic axial filament protein CafA and Ribonuclease G [Lutibaculum baratangense AMV1]